MENYGFQDAQNDIGVSVVIFLILYIIIAGRDTIMDPFKPEKDLESNDVESNAYASEMQSVAPREFLDERGSA